jgi:nucleotide-binding universal stress UspA family protein
MMTDETTSEAKPYVVVAALAFDETGEAALREAAQVAGAGCELHVVHIVREGAHATTKGEMGSLNKHLDDATAKLREFLAAKGTSQRVVCHVRVGDFARSILQVAVDVNADLLIVGTHQRKGVAKLWLGSVAKEVLEHAHCPVLVALPKDYTGKTVSDSIQPPCPDCVTIRQQTKGETFWCERHQHAYMKPHVYVPTGASKASVIPGGH